MGKFLKRTLAIFMILLTLFMMIPLSVFAADDDYTAESQTDIEYQSTNALSDVLANAMQEDEEKQTEEGYYILDVTVADYTATVEFYAPEDTQLIVAVYNEDGTKLITSAKTDIYESSKKVGNETELLQEELFFETELPEYFLLKAFLLDSENKPVCRSFESKKYTKAFQDFLKKETTDFEEEKVINLDESTQNNFAVVSDETNIIEQTENENTLTVNDFENGVYTFENANSDITELKKGDVFYYVYGEGAEDYILTKVGSIENNSGTVTVTAAEETEISDFFSYIKIDTSESKVEQEASTNKLNKAAIDINPQAWFTIGFSQGFESGNLSGSATGQVAIKVDFRFYYDFKLLGKDYYDISNRVEYTSTSELALSASAGFETDDPIRIVYTIFPITAGLNGTLTVGFNFSAKAEINVSGTLEFSGVSGFRNVSGQKSESLSVSPKAVYKFNASVEGVITITPIVVVDFIALGVVDVGVGAEFEIKLTIKLFEIEATNEEEDPDIIHTCIRCVDGNMKMVFTIFAQAEFGLTEETKLLLARLDFSLPEIEIGDFYISFKESPYGPVFDKFDWCKCPNKKYKVNVTVLDKEDKPIQNAVITEATKEAVKSDGTTAPAPVEDFTTDETGKATAYFPVDEHSVRGKHEEFVLDNERMPEPEVDFVIEEVEEEEEEEYEPIDLTIYMELEPDGQCGDYAYYSIFNKKTLYIFGEGDMWDFEKNVYGFWYGYFSINNLIIDEGITAIGDYAFSNCYSLPSVTIPDSVTNIGEYSFSECWRLENIKMKFGITKISEGAFEGCDKLEKITIPNSVTCIGNRAFYKCVSLKRNLEIPNSVTTIGEDAFYNCQNLDSIIIPDSVTSIGDSAFCYCSSLKNVTIGNSVTSIGYQAFVRCYSLESVTIPDGVITIGREAFSNCDNLQSVTIGNSVTTIGEWAFSHCDKITSVTIGNSVTTIGHCAFWECPSLNNVYIPDCVTTIKGYAFNATALQSISLPLGISYLGESYINENEVVVYFRGTKNEWKFSLPKYYVFADESRLPEYYNTYLLNTANETPSALTAQPALKTETIETIPGYNYIIAVVKSDTAEDLLNSSNLIYIDQKEADSDTLSFSFVLDEDVTDYKVLFFSDEAHSHSYEMAETAATCTSEGKKVYTCSCGDSYTETIPVKGHSEVTVKGKAATCSSTGLTDGKKCSVCGTVNVAQETVAKIPHSEVNIAGKSATCTATGLTEGKKCSVCGIVTVEQSTIAKKAHTYKTTTTKATLSKNGSVVTACSVCGTKKSTTTIYYPKSITLSTTTYTYDGKNKTPTVTVRDSQGNKLVKNVDYKLTVASSRSGIGRYTVKVTLIGNYSGTKNLYFYILPGATSKVTASSQTTSSVKLTWNKVSGAAGYTVYRYSPSKKAYVKVGATTKNYMTVSKLLAGTKYTFRVYAYGKTAAGKVYNSNKYALIKTATCTATPTIKLASTAKGRATVAWTNVSGETGYQVYYSLSKSSGYKRIANYKANTTKAYKTGLTSGKTYYFKVRAYTKTDSGYVYSAFSPVKSIKVK